MNLHDEILRGMARAFFASAYADQYDEADKPGFRMSGRDFMDVIPGETDPAALHAARTFAMGLCSENHCVALDELFMRCSATHSYEPVRRRGDRELTPDLFGHYLAMQAMGHGVGLRDAFGDVVYQAVKVPYVEFGGYSLERDYFGRSH
ncbi:hypothetical protein [Paraburkholderia dinghuensis]|uniref:Uncharacterized protein n=1 Tax=Paraburkholderia dinghuensis TaxID=2305225 RepID=A0A3N6MFK4_9BURK|nr:hypothetical protein [Paraburkholderia dinghuensis]RQH02739.1 hypothetical protein D1Y85_21640 [Paraburkholderia dinghuensis]